jgi:hypothetical protein
MTTNVNTLNPQTNLFHDLTSLPHSLSQYRATHLDPIISEIYERVVKNPSFWALCAIGAATAAITFAAIVLPAALAIGVSLVVFATLGIGLYAQSNETKKWLFSELSLLNSSIAEQLPAWIYRHPWYTEITPQITLGSAPLKSRCHFQNIRDTHQAVLSMIQNFEHDPHLLGVPVKPEDWRHAGIAFLNLPNPDLTPVKLEDVKAGVEWMHQQIFQNKKVYVHCLAGVGRSATIVICYLVKYCHYTPEQAVNLIKSKRMIAVDQNSPAVAAFVSDLARTQAQTRVA